MIQLSCYPRVGIDNEWMEFSDRNEMESVGGFLEVRGIINLDFKFLGVKIWHLWMFSEKKLEVL